MLKDLIIIGASGFGREAAWLVERINHRNPTWNLLGFLDDNKDIVGKDINGYSVLGTSEDVEKFREAYFVCAIGNSRVREKMIGRITEINSEVMFATLIDPSVVISDLVKIGRGTIICAHTIITVNIDMGEHVIINLDCTIGHDAVIEDFVTLYPSVNVSGITTIRRNVEMGTGSQIIQGKKIGEYSIIGAGAVVVKDIPANCTAVGCPAKIIKSVPESVQGTLP
ncbi:MAG: acetyltransferase [Lachnospiraceae bacterium]|nr:acetyltransferase [Lachnospiraceae bacterium]